MQPSNKQAGRLPHFLPERKARSARRRPPHYGSPSVEARPSYGVNREIDNASGPVNLEVSRGSVAKFATEQLTAPAPRIGRGLTGTWSICQALVTFPRSEDEAPRASF